jgi:hypothetical protein
MGSSIYFSKIAVLGTTHLEQPGFCLFVTVFSLHKAYFIFLWCIEPGKVFANAPGFFQIGTVMENVHICAWFEKPYILGFACA